MIIFSIGISGCGKTTYGLKLLKKFRELIVVCPDDIRKELTGNTSDQSQNKQVFSIARDRIREALRQGKSVYFSACNLTKKSRKMIYELAKEFEQELVAVIFCTSWRPDICENRVKKDLNNGVDRSNTVIKDEDGKTIIRLQFEKWKDCMLNLKSLKEELKENSTRSAIKWLECQPE